ncbi:MAG: phosphoribosylformylglycinamidine synthase, partial [Propionivibrio sp.]
MADIPDILFLRGNAAFSAFRLQSLQQLLQTVSPGARITGADYWHIVKLNAPLTDAERAQLGALLEQGADDGRAEGELCQLFQLFLVVPRLGTLSPWSSKATDIAWNCGLRAIERIERGIAYHIDGVNPDQRTQVVALLHDRMTETVLADFA